MTVGNACNNLLVRQPFHWCILCSRTGTQELKQRSSESTEAKPQLNPAATSFYPGTSHPFTPGSPYAPGASRVVVATSGEKSDMSEFARFMVSRELINTSLTKFDDRAESYRAWKATFKAAIANLNFTAEQELDLLIKWLGPGSTNRIKSLRTVYVGQAEAGLAAAWQRLERTFGSAEAIEKALFKRLQDIPKINLKEVHKLQDLSDLLMELELAKRDPRLSGLCYLDTAHGVNPIVVKLPYSLQEKWATSVSRYKRMHDVTFPPFIQFCKFINEQESASHIKQSNKGRRLICKMEENMAALKGDVTSENHRCQVALEGLIYRIPTDRRLAPYYKTRLIENSSKGNAQDGIYLQQLITTGSHIDSRAVTIHLEFCLVHILSEEGAG
ncbi:uncharacterized protein ACNLHF_027143 [Anomaloglossus baeobatrachus]